MPSKSQAQARFMAMIAHGKKATKSGGKKPPSMEVAKEFNAADKGHSLKRLPKRISAKQQGKALRKFKK